MRSSPASQAVLVVVAFAVATGVALHDDWPWIDLVFVGVLLSFLLLLARFVWGSVSLSRSAVLRERAVVAVAPGEAARRAVEDERARLSAEIDRSVRRSLFVVRDLVGDAEAADDPRGALVEIQRESRAAMTELRRQLGLINGDDEQASDVDAHTPSGVGAAPVAVGAAPAGAQPIGRFDVVLAGAVLGLTLVEMLLIPGQTGSVALSAAMALTVLVHRVAPVPAALACATILLLGAVAEANVGDGVFYAVVVGLLMWRLLEPTPAAVSLASAAVLYVCAVGTRLLHDPSNAPITAVILLLVAVAAIVVGRTRRRRARAEQRSFAHHAALVAAGESAARDTRREVARELHDVVSHAVSLVAVQAGAAELAWPHDPPAARAGLRAIDETVATALTELDGRQGEAAPGWEDLIRTVQRLRSAGLRVELDLGPPPPEAQLPTVHRIVQEALTNVLKHAPGATAYVVVSRDGTGTLVEVSDDGPGRSGPSNGYGLVGLEDRVTALGGTLSVRSGDRGGFVLRAVLPDHRAQVRTS